MLDECLGYLSERQEQDSSFTYEVLVVSDGSKDGTVRLAHEYARRWGTDTLRVLDLQPNRGKGGAIRLVSHP
jgi:dolichyl-phosphate beta-glucosyltransferase